SAQAGTSVVNYLLEIIAERRAHPKDDLISALITVGIDGHPLSTEEVLDTAFLLFIAGLDTVTNQLSVIFHHLARHPDLQHHLRSSPEAIPAALEELLRVYPIVPPARTLTSDYTLDGIEMKTATRCCSRPARPAGTPQPSTIPVKSASTAVPAGPPRSVWALIVAWVRIWRAKNFRSCCS
ncbi:MAG TPA: cytochrome P450, partial [Mycobacterium sp.]